MKIHFYIRYKTQVGQSLAVVGNCTALGNDDPSNALKLDYLNEEFWHGSIEMDEKKRPAALKYHYLFFDKTEEQKTDWDTDRSLDLAAWKATEIRCFDFWNPAGAIENAFFTQPFQQIFLKNEQKTVETTVSNFTHLFRVKAPLLKNDESVVLLGASDSLKNWDKTTPIFLIKKGNFWSVELNLEAADFPLAYKYGIWNSAQNRFLEFETGDNRILFSAADLTKKKTQPLTVLHDGFARFQAQAWRGAGVAIPVFSLKTEASFGIGEFTDLPKLTDWAASVGLKLLQLLPINDTAATGTWTDSYPYASISAFALNPIYVNIFEIGGEKNSSILKPFLKKQAALNSLQAIDYEAVMSEKWAALRLLFAAQKTAFLKDKNWLDYFEANRHWLVAYAAFCFLKAKNGTADFSKWTTHAVFSQKEIERLAAPDSPDFEEIALHFFVQFHLHRQLKSATDYAHAAGLAVKGDIPIGIYRYSADAWTAPELYEMNAQAGAPPDDFAEKGQNWGFPTYNWERMKADDFAWWRQRFEQMSAYFDAFRIDHILGFFRIWSIPIDAVEGILGRFVPALPVFLNEFYENGIAFDYDRFCKPFITVPILNALFGEAAEQVVATFLERNEGGRFSFRPEFSTQIQVAAFFEKLEKTPENDRVREGLFSLISNVILYDSTPPISVEKEAGRVLPQFHFRISMEKTSSFQSLDHETQNRLNSLYINYFYRRQDEFWRREAMEKLPALKRSTNMLICGEDLGMVPACVPGVMQELGILSLEIQRMPKALGAAFFHPKDAPYLSVVTPSTHDMSTIRGWWEENSAQTQRFFNEILVQQGRAPQSCEAWVNRFIVKQHLDSPAMWAIFQLQDLMGSDSALRRASHDDERINQPANPKHYWQYRMHLTLENLEKATDFNQSLREMVVESGR